MYVHGDLNIPPSLYDVYDEENEEYESRLYESSCLAIGILTATIQEMILLDKKELKFILGLTYFFKE